MSDRSSHFCRYRRALLSAAGNVARWSGFARGRGRFQVMVLVMVLAKPGLAQASVDEEAITLPSGQTVTFVETLVEEDAHVLRLRFVAPDLADPKTRPDFDALSADFEMLCHDYALPELQKLALPSPQVIVSLSSEPVVFGTIVPDVVQLFEAFSVENDSCMLELF